MQNCLSLTVFLLKIRIQFVYSFYKMMSILYFAELFFVTFFHNGENSFLGAKI